MNRNWVGLFLILVLSFISLICVVQYNAAQLRKKEKESAYCGRFEKVTYDAKHDPSILIQNNWRFMGFYGNAFSKYFQKDDSICKVENSEAITVFRFQDSIVVEVKKFRMVW